MKITLASNFPVEAATISTFLWKLGGESERILPSENKAQKGRFLGQKRAKSNQVVLAPTEKTQPNNILKGSGVSSIRGH